MRHAPAGSCGYHPNGPIAAAPMPWDQWSLPPSPPLWRAAPIRAATFSTIVGIALATRSEKHTSELQSLMRISYAVFCLKKKNTNNYKHHRTTNDRLQHIKV